MPNVPKEINPCFQMFLTCLLLRPKGKEIEEKVKTEILGRETDSSAHEKSHTSWGGTGLSGGFTSGVSELTTGNSPSSRVLHRCIR